MLPQLRDGTQRVITGNVPVLDKFPTPNHNLASGIALAGTGDYNKKPTPTDDGVNSITGIPVAGTTTGPITVGTQPSEIRNRLPNIIPKFGSHREKTTSWLIILAAVGAFAGVYTAYQNRS